MSKRVRMGLNQTGPHRYKPLNDCRENISEYIEEFHIDADDNDSDAIDEVSAVSYEGHLKWYDHWLDHLDKNEFELKGSDARKMATQLKWEFNGTTPRNRYDRITHFHDWLVKNEYTEKNPYKRWTSRELKLTKTTEQSKHLDEGEDYACSVSDIKAMEKHPGRYEIRNQLIIRLMWHTGCRRDELASIEIAIEEEDEMRGENEKAHDDIDIDKRTIHIRNSVSKNNEERYVGWKESVDGLLNMWLSQRDRWNTNNHPYLFIGERGGRLDGDAISEIIVQSAYRAGINRKLYADANAAVDEDGNPIKNRDLITSHNVRHGLATKMIDDDCDPYRVSRYMGHSSVEFTIENYVEEDPKDGLPALEDYNPDRDTAN